MKSKGEANMWRAIDKTLRGWWGDRMKRERIVIYEFAFANLHYAKICQPLLFNRRPFLQDCPDNLYWWWMWKWICKQNGLQFVTGNLTTQTILMHSVRIKAFLVQTIKGIFFKLFSGHKLTKAELFIVQGWPWHARNALLMSKGPPKPLRESTIAYHCYDQIMHEFC